MKKMNYLILLFSVLIFSSNACAKDYEKIFLNSKVFAPDLNAKRTDILGEVETVTERKYIGTVSELINRIKPYTTGSYNYGFYFGKQTVFNNFSEVVKYYNFDGSKKSGYYDDTIEILFKLKQKNQDFAKLLNSQPGASIVLQCKFVEMECDLDPYSGGPNKRLSEKFIKLSIKDNIQNDLYKYGIRLRPNANYVVSTLLGNSKVGLDDEIIYFEYKSIDGEIESDMVDTLNKLQKLFPNTKIHKNSYNDDGE